VIGEVIGNFKITSRLGRGGMGEVYLAEHAKIGTKVAIKLLLPELSADKTHVDRFFNEALAVSRIKHAGIVRIFDVGHHNGSAYLIMEFLEGESLAGRIARSGRLSLGQICDVGRQIASILDATHAEGVTHRDLKPDNVFLVSDAELASRERVKILDFGIAKLTGTLASGSPKTMGVMGTPGYMAPEQWGDSAKVDWRADVYSLGCLAFEMACGRQPFIAQHFAEAYAKHLNEPPPPIRSLVPELPEALDGLIAQLLAKQPQDRPASMRAIADRFEALGKGQPGALDKTMLPGHSDPDLRPPDRGPTHPEAVTPHAITPAGAVTPAHVTPASVTPASDTPANVTPANVTPASVTPMPANVTPAGASPIPSPDPAKPVTTISGSAGERAVVATDVTAPRPNRTLAIGVGAVGVLGVGVVIYLATRSGHPAEPATQPIEGAGSQLEPGGAADEPASLRERIERANPYVDDHGTQLQTHQVSSREYGWYLDSLSGDAAAAAQPLGASASSDGPVAWVTFERARRFCEAIGASLPTDDQWTRCAGGTWGIDPAKRGVMGPLEEWTATVQDGLAIVRGAYATMSEDDKELAIESPMKKPTEALAGFGAPANVIASSQIGFRCAR